MVLLWDPHTRSHLTRPLVMRRQPDPLPVNIGPSRTIYRLVTPGILTWEMLCLELIFPRTFHASATADWDQKRHVLVRCHVLSVHPFDGENGTFMGLLASLKLKFSLSSKLTGTKF